MTHEVPPWPSQCAAIEGFSQTGRFGNRQRQLWVDSRRLPAGYRATAISLVLTSTWWQAGLQRLPSVTSVRRKYAIFP